MQGTEKDVLQKLQEQLERERALRLEHEDALCDALEEVRSRSASLQLRMQQGGVSWPDSAVGSPQRLQTIACAARIADETRHDVSHADNYDGGVRDAADARRSPLLPKPPPLAPLASTEAMQLQLLASQRYVASLEEQLARQGREAAELRKAAAAQQELHEHNAREQHAMVDQLTATAEMACGALHALLERCQSTPGQTEVAAEAIERLVRADRSDRCRAEWVGGARRELLSWVSAHLSRQASAALREERLHKDVRTAHEGCTSATDAARSRAERAERRCRHLVGALRSTARETVDTFYMSQNEGHGNRHDCTIQTQREIIERRRSLAWEQERTRPHEGERIAAQPPGRRTTSKQAMAWQLGLATMPASSITTRYDELLAGRVH
jgi:hypothetical protein